MAQKKNQKKNYKKYYTTTSEALKVQEDYIPNKKRKKVKILKIIKLPTKYKYLLDKKSRIPLVTYVTIVVVFIGGAINLSLDAKKYYVSLRLDSLHQTLNSLKEENGELKLQISDGYDLIEVEQIATARLGMKKPQAYQIIDIEIEKSNFANHGEMSLIESDPIQAKTSFIKNFLDKILGR